MVKIFFGALLFITLASCSFAPKDLKSPCVAIESSDGQPSPCIRRNANAHWLI